MPLAVYVLALGTFCLGTSEFMLAGLLPQLSDGLGVSIPRAGLLITAFAIGMTLGAPVMTLATLRLPRRATLLSAAAVFAAVHLLPLAFDGYAAVFAGRVIAAVACATYWAVGAVIAVRLAGPDLTARALAAIVGGLTLSNILGVPAGTWIGEQLGWQAAFVAVAIATIVIIGVLRVMVPVQPHDDASTPMKVLVRRELVAFRDRRLWLALATTASFQAAVFCCFSYLAPLLTDVAGISDSRVPLVLLLFGVGSFVGVTIGGRYADRDLLVNVCASLGAMTLALLLLIVLAGSGVGVVVATFLFGATAFSIAAALNGRVFAFAGDAPTLAASVNVSAFNVGNAIGPWIGGLVIDAGLGLRAPAWAAIGLALMALTIAAFSWRLERGPAARRTDCPDAVCASA
ncbi:chemotaxis protein [Luteipulveratus halotolerans]|uniref:Chemotaxis protein n=1 Tax=Luteipulveratus halotolerans TaxID=1631356 RepID=A0A0L6CPJ7_9MICO|nr:chemotaxis protein [Luteipulveratus halotolerans]